MFLRVFRWKCDLCGADAENANYGFPPGFKYFHKNAQTCHICPNCIAQAREITQIVDNQPIPLLTDSKRSKSEVILNWKLFEEYQNNLTKRFWDGWMKTPERHSNTVLQ